MRFLIDECTGPAVARWLRDREHDVFSVYQEARGKDDEEVIQRAFAEDRVLSSNDKDFGERIYREGLPHRGVILLCLADERPAARIDVLQRHLAAYTDRIVDQFVVVIKAKLRFCPNGSCEIQIST